MGKWIELRKDQPETPGPDRQDIPPADPGRVPEDARKCPIFENTQFPVYLPEKQRAAIELLAAGQPLNRVAEALSIDQKTLYRWRCDPEFGAALSARVNQMWGEASERLRTMAIRAVDLLQEQLYSRSTESCYRAARSVFTLCVAGTVMARSQLLSDQARSAAAARPVASGPAE